jgi:nucleoside 2-deoxyribosyltransferase
MKIYFGFTVAGDRSAIVTARKIVGLLLEMGHEVLTRHLVEDNAWEQDRALTPKEVYLRDITWLDHCDAFLAEVSGSSFGVGFETGYLLGATSKKVALFYRREAELIRIARWYRTRTSTKWQFGLEETCRICNPHDSTVNQKR